MMGMKTTTEMKPGTVVGTVTISETREWKRSNEFAGHDTRVEVPAGTYELVKSGSRFVARIPATQTYDGWFGTNTRIDTERRPTEYALTIESYWFVDYAKGRGQLSFRKNPSLPDGVTLTLDPTFSAEDF